MDAAAIAREKALVERHHGTWTAHNLRLADGLYTMSPAPSGDEPKLRRIVQIVADVAALTGRSIADLRVLDLASLEGMYSLELAARGATVLGIEGREANLAKAEFAARALALDTVEFQLGDVRELSRQRHGEFDVVLCLGIFYHLDTPDVFLFAERIHEVCRTAAIFDTWVSPHTETMAAHDGRRYHGMTIFEHRPDEPEEVRKARLWSSLDNPSAFAPTRPSLYRLLSDVGFTSVFECHVPPEREKPADRLTLLALKGVPTTPLLTLDVPVEFRAEPGKAPFRAVARGIAGGKALARRVLRRPVQRL
jgi:hypothetical protein